MIHPLLSEVTNFSPPMEIGIWLACACFTIWFLLLVKKGIRELRGEEPYPPNAKLGQSVKDINRRLEGLERWREELSRKMESDKIEILTSGQDREERLHGHIDEYRKELDGKIEDLPERIISTLKNTGAI